MCGPCPVCTVLEGSRSDSHRWPCLCFPPSLHSVCVGRWVCTGVSHHEADGRTDGLCQGSARHLVFVLLSFILFSLKENFPNFITFRAQRPSSIPGMCVCACAPGCVLCASLWLSFPILALRYIGSPWEVLLSFTHVFKCLWIFK